MTQTFIQGRRVPATKVTAGPCVVTQIKTPQKDGYWAIQIGYGEKKIKNISKPLQGHLKKTVKDKNAPCFLAEVRFEEEPKTKDGKSFNLGDIIFLTDIFKEGDVVLVRGISKGKGFAGVVKRWHFAGGPRTHGQSDRERAPGAISSGTTPGRVRKGKKMAGRMGAGRITVKNLQVISIDKEKNELNLNGPVPGPKGTLVVIKKLCEGKLEGITQVQAQVIEGEGISEEKPEEEKKEEIKNA